MAHMFDTVHERLSKAETNIIANRDSIGETDDLHESLDEKTCIKRMMPKLSGRL